MQGEFDHFDKLKQDRLELEAAIGSLQGASLFDHLIESESGLSKSKLITAALLSENSVQAATALFFLEEASPEILASHSGDLLAFLFGPCSTSESVPQVLDFFVQSDTPAAHRVYQNAVLSIINRGKSGHIHQAFSHAQGNSDRLSSEQLLECGLTVLRTRPGGVHEDLLREQILLLLRGEETDRRCAVLEEMASSDSYSPETRAFAAGNLFELLPERSVELLVGMITQKFSAQEVADFDSYLLFPTRFEESVRASLQYAKREVAESLLGVVANPSRTYEERYLALRALGFSRDIVEEQIDLFIYHFGVDRQPGDGLFKGALLHSIGNSDAAVSRRGHLLKMLLPHLQSKEIPLARQACVCIGRLWDQQKGDSEVILPLARILITRSDTVVEFAIDALKRITPEDSKDILRLVAEHVKSDRHKHSLKSWLG